MPSFVSRPVVNGVSLRRCLKSILNTSPDTTNTDLFLYCASHYSHVNYTKSLRNLKKKKNNKMLKCTHCVHKIVYVLELYLIKLQLNSFCSKSLNCRRSFGILIKSSCCFFFRLIHSNVLDFFILICEKISLHPKPKKVERKKKYLSLCKTLAMETQFIRSLRKT